MTAIATIGMVMNDIHEDARLIYGNQLDEFGGKHSHCVASSGLVAPFYAVKMRSPAITSLLAS